MRASTECNVVLALYLAMYAPYAQTQDPGYLNASGAGRDTRGRGARHARDWQGGIGTRQQKGLDPANARFWNTTRAQQTHASLEGTAAPAGAGLPLPARQSGGGPGNGIGGASKAR